VGTVHYLDEVIGAELHHQVCSRLENSPWTFGHGSVQGQGRPFWKMILDQDAMTDQIWLQAQPQCEALAGGKLIVLRQYANGHTYGQGGAMHADDSRAGSFTLLYYPIREWQDEWEGETVFYDANGEISYRVMPKPQRAILFDARIPHAGLAPSQAFHGLRKSIAFKLLLKSVFDAQPLPSYSLEQLVCEPFDRIAQEASQAALHAGLIEQLAKNFSGAIPPHFLVHEKQRIAHSMRAAGSIISVSESEIEELALHRLRSGMAILGHAKTLGLESGAPLTEQRTLAALLGRAQILKQLVSREELLAVCN
jgi:2OG-Fe(II) oxygenase superfamily